VDARRGENPAHNGKPINVFSRSNFHSSRRVKRRAAAVSRPQRSLAVSMDGGRADAPQPDDALYADDSRPAWFLLQPIMLTGVLTLVMARSRRTVGRMPYVGVRGFRHHSLDHVQSFAARDQHFAGVDGSIFSKVYFPRILVPLAALMTSAVEFLPVYALLLHWCGLRAVLRLAYSAFSGFCGVDAVAVVRTWTLADGVRSTSRRAVDAPFVCSSCSIFRRSFMDRRQFRRAGVSCFSSTR